MFSWGQDSHRGFRVKDNDTAAAGGVHVFFHPGYVLRELAASRGARAFVSGDREAFTVRGHDSEDGRTGKVKPKRVKSSEKIRAVSCGDETVVLLSEGGKLLCVDTNQTSLVPRTPEGLANTKIAQVACGSRHVVALSEGGEVYTWGQGSRGQLGVGQTELRSSQPQHLPSLSLIPLVQVAAGGEQSFALSVSGGVFGWGRNDCGQLGLGSTTDQHVPTSIDCLIMKKTVHICCGRDHTVILTKDGVVFTFGSGQYGQLGHNSLNDELRPRLVAELWRTKVTRIACGCYHTLVMTEHRKLYSFGCNTHGQLGRGPESHPSVPLPVLLPQDACSGLVVRNIFSGGNCSFATCSSIKKVNKEASVNAAPQLHALIDKWVSQYDSNNKTTIKQEIRSAFCSASYLNQCFLDQRKDKHYGTSPKCSGLNLQLVQGAFEKLAKKSGLLAEVVAAALRLLPSLGGSPAGVEGLRIFLLLTELLHVTQTSGDAIQLADLICQTVDATVARLSDGHVQVIVDWWYSQNPTIMQRHVQVWKLALKFGLTWAESFPYSPVLKNILRILKCMYEVNSQTGRPRIPGKKFAMEIFPSVISDELHLCWDSQEDEVDHEDSIIFDYTFLMDLRSKKEAFDQYAGFSKQLFTDDLELHLRRTALADDAFAQLAAADPGDYQKPLTVLLDGTTKGSLVYQKDFFHHVFDQLVSTNPKMFQFNDAQTVAWFPTTATEEDRKAFHLFGVLCGLALYNHNVIQLPFPLALFKKLVNAKLTLDDMKEFQPSVGRSLEEVSNYGDDVLAALFLDFTIEWDGKTAELDPQNPGKEVTSQNRKEFVDAYVNHVFDTSVRDAFQEFERGFFQVCDREVVDLFRPEELQEFLVGKDVYDWNKLKRNTRYEFPCVADHPVIMMFWEVFDELNEDEKRDFVWFVTGFRKLPISGIEITIRAQFIQSGSPDDNFPTTLTCYSILELPAYSKKKIMRKRLREALSSERVYYGSTTESES